MFRRILSASFLTLLTACSGSTGNGPSAVSPRVLHPLPNAEAVAASNAPATGTAALPSRLVVSVLYFEDRTRTPELRWLRKGLADMLTTDLSRAPGVQVVLRERLETILREQALQAGGRIEDRTAVRIGHLAGATVILAGSVTRVGDLLRLDAQLLDVERGTVIGATTIEGGTGEVLVLQKQLSAHVLALLAPDLRPDSVERSLLSQTRAPTSSSEAAAALYEGVDAADRGDVASALAKFEAALGKDPRYAEAQGRYERALRTVDADALWARVGSREATPEDRRRLAARLADELLRQGIRAEITGVTSEGGTVGGRGVKVGVRAWVDDQALQHLRQGVVRLGGAVEEREGLLLVRISDDPAIQAAFSQVINPARRLFLHILAADGRRLAVFSRFRGWRETDWMSPGRNGVVGVHVRHTVSDEVLLTGLSDNLPAQVRASLDLVPREQAVIQVELLGTTEIGREVLLSPRAPQGRREKIDGPPDVMTKWADDFRAILGSGIEEGWDPPVWERVPGPGYLPGARRSAMVSAALQSGASAGKHPVLAGPPTLSGKSGDAEFDAACVRAVSGLEVRAGRGDRPPVLPEGGAPQALRVRITCDLLKEIPTSQPNP